MNPGSGKHTFFASLLVATLGFCANTTLAQNSQAGAFDAQDYEYCLVCHGAQGQGNPVIQAPVLAGMESWSVRNQLQAFRAGWRGAHAMDLLGMEMRPMAMALDPGEIPAVVKSLEALPARRSAQTEQAELTGGLALYAPCATCHGSRAEGIEALQAPALFYQDEAYLIRQLKNFREGIRGGHPDDRRGASMAAAAKDLDDTAITTVVAYLRSLTP